MKKSEGREGAHSRAAVATPDLPTEPLRMATGSSSGGSPTQVYVVEPFTPDAHLALGADALIAGNKVTPAEASALRAAGRQFQQDLAASGVAYDPDSPEYGAAWQRAARGSDDLLRAWLGWDRFMALSGEAYKAALDQVADKSALANPPRQ